MATDSMALLERLGKAADEGDVDFLRQGVKALARVLMEAEVSTLIDAQHGERAPDRRRPTATAIASDAGTPAWDHRAAHPAGA